jgi:ribosomal protein RSM22 (predicted rRNA methylase)
MALVLVDPGTPAAWQRMMLVRQHLLSLGAHLAAPCAHADTCPLPEGDWCHFARRVPRTRLHREIKGGERSFEDEKFTYLVFTRHPIVRSSRILRRPEYQKNLVRLSLCTPQGIAARNVTKSQKDDYKKARDASWGDSWR